MASIAPSIKKCRELQKPFFNLCVERARQLKRTEAEFKAFLIEIFVWGGDENYWMDKINNLKY